jgi:hypothetical protein
MLGWQVVLLSTDVLNAVFIYVQLWMSFGKEVYIIVPYDNSRCNKPANRNYNSHVTYVLSSNAMLSFAAGTTQWTILTS